MKTIFISLQTKSLSQQRATPPGHAIRTPTAQFYAVTYEGIGDWHHIDQQDGVKLKIDFKPTLGRPRPIKQKK